jgi:hypothetical protein
MPSSLIFDHSNVRAPSKALLCDFDNGCIYKLRLDGSQSQTIVENSPVTGEGEKDDDDVRRAAAELKNRTASCISCSLCND